jgi:GT2 family glycosyltransferase
VVIPTYNRRAQLARVLEALAAQQPGTGDFEVIVVSDGSTDGTDEYLRSSAPPLPVTALSQTNAGPAAARNRGVEAARGELILFIDDDVVADPHLVASHVRAHERLGAGWAVLGPMLEPPDERLSRWIRWEQAMLDKQYAAMLAGEWSATPRQFYTGNASLARSIVVDAGGFDTAFRRAEDVEFAYRVAHTGVKFTFEPECRSYHYAHRSFGSWLANARAYGQNDVIFGRDRGEQWLLGQVAKEFHEKNPLVRALTRVALVAPFVEPLAERTLNVVSAVADKVHLDSVSRQALSGIYNTAYYRGVAKELGGRETFLKLLAYVGKG